MSGTEPNDPMPDADFPIGPTGQHRPLNIASIFLFGVALLMLLLFLAY